MTTAYLVVHVQIVGNLDSWSHDYSSDMVQHPTRIAANNSGWRTLGHDDFQIATVVDGKLAGIGWGAGVDARDFDLDEEGLPTIARHLGLDLAGHDVWIYPYGKASRSEVG